MFSLRLEFSLQSQLGRHLSLLQHVTALAIVLAIKNIPECLVIIKTISLVATLLFTKYFVHLLL